MNENNEEIKRHCVTFVEWLTNNDSPYAVSYGDDKRFITNRKSYSIKDVYEQYRIYCNKKNKENEYSISK